MEGESVKDGEILKDGGWEGVSVGGSLKDGRKFEGRRVGGSLKDGGWGEV